MNRKLACCLISILALLSCTYCQKENDFVSVACIRSVFVYVENACNVLTSKGVDCFAHGSRAYSVCVSPKDLERAKKILTEDAKKRPYNYVTIEGYTGKLGFPDSSEWKTLKFDIDLLKIDSAPELRADANLRGIFRGTAKECGTIRYENGRHAYVKKIRLKSFEYMDKKGILQPAYNSIVTLGYRGMSSDYDEKLTMWSWNQGRDHQTTGSA